MTLPESITERIIAKQVQDRLAPDHFPTVPGLEYAVESQRTGELGGDFYDFISAGSSSFYVSIGDIAREGAAAGMVMAAMQVSMREHAFRDDASVSGTVRDLNRTVVQLSPEDVYASLFHARIDTDRGVMEYVNSGYDFVVLVRDLQKAMVLERTGTVLGLSARSTFDQRTIQITSGDVLIAVTDGVADAMDIAGESLDERVFLDTVRKHPYSSSSDLARQIVERADRIAEDFELGSDRSALVIRFLEVGKAVEDLRSAA